MISRDTISASRPTDNERTDFYLRREKPARRRTSNLDRSTIPVPEIGDLTRDALPPSLPPPLARSVVSRSRFRECRKSVVQLPPCLRHRADDDVGKRRASGLMVRTGETRRITRVPQRARARARVFCGSRATAADEAAVMLTNDRPRTARRIRFAAAPARETFSPRATATLSTARCRRFLALLPGASVDPSKSRGGGARTDSRA